MRYNEISTVLKRGKQRSHWEVTRETERISVLHFYSNIMQKGNINGSWEREINKNYWIKVQLMCHDLMAMMVSKATTGNGGRKDCTRGGRKPLASASFDMHDKPGTYTYTIYAVYIRCEQPLLHMHNCHPFLPCTHTHTHPLWQPSRLVGLNENGACWPNERELCTYVATSIC